MRFPAAVAALCLGAFAGCFIGAGSFAGKGCDSNNDCPDPYVCAQVRGTGRSCELVHDIDIGVGGAGGGGGMVNVDPDYCHDVKPILDRTCVANCHGPDISGGGGNTFRLDQYSVAVVGGAFEKRARVQARVSADDMPPPGPANPRPTAAERALVIRWVTTGGENCRGGGTDGGTPDGGTGDGGVKLDGGDGG